MKMQIVIEGDLADGPNRTVNILVTNVRGFPLDRGLTMVIMDTAKKHLSNYFDKQETKIEIVAKMPQEVLFKRGNRMN